jgi:hypothetical protein
MTGAAGVDFGASTTTGSGCATLSSPASSLSATAAGSTGVAAAAAIVVGIDVDDDSSLSAAEEAISFGSSVTVDPMKDDGENRALFDGTNASAVDAATAKPRMTEVENFILLLEYFSRLLVIVQLSDRFNLTVSFRFGLFSVQLRSTRRRKKETTVLSPSCVRQRMMMMMMEERDL